MKDLWLNCLLFLKWLKRAQASQRIRHRRLYPARHRSLPPEGPNQKTSRKIYKYILWELQPHHRLPVWYGNYCCYPDATKTYGEHASSRVLRNEWQTTGTFPFQAKLKKTQKGHSYCIPWRTIWFFWLWLFVLLSLSSFEFYSQLQACLVHREFWRCF